jgi:HNH endonuclease
MPCFTGEGERGGAEEECDVSVDCRTLRELLDYDWRTGVMKWRVRRNNRCPAGTIAGHKHKSSGYISVKIDSKWYLAHRLAWLHYHGRWPVDQIDHINGNSHDNRIANLREATPGQNTSNRRRAKNNTSGFKGVILVKGRWRAIVRKGDVAEIVGHFKTPHEAYLAYCKRAAELFGEYFRPE